MSYCQQKKLYLAHGGTYAPFTIGNPLFVVVGVNAVRTDQGRTVYPMEWISCYSLHNGNNRVY
jgi:hypothetical protein